VRPPFRATIHGRVLCKRAIRRKACANSPATQTLCMEMQRANPLTLTVQCLHSMCTQERGWTQRRRHCWWEDVIAIDVGEATEGRQRPECETPRPRTAQEPAPLIGHVPAPRRRIRHNTSHFHAFLCAQVTAGGAWGTARATDPLPRRAMLAVATAEIVGVGPHGAVHASRGRAMRPHTGAASTSAGTGHGDRRGAWCALGECPRLDCASHPAGHSSSGARQSPRPNKPTHRGS
jgi:hypothetical protein